MPTEAHIRRLTIGCAIFMFFGPLGGRTMWVGRDQIATDPAIYNVAALFSGVVALAALAFALWGREHQWRSLPALSALISAAAFALTVYVAGLFVWARWQGEVWSYGGGFAGDPGPNEEIILPWGPPFFALAALIGALASLSLAIIWLRKPQDVAARLVSIM